LPVALAIAIKDKKFLLIKRGLPLEKGMWSSLSAFIEIGETPEETCLRKLKEETGVSGEIVKLAGVIRREDKEVYGDMLIVEYLEEGVEEASVIGKVVGNREGKTVKTWSKARSFSQEMEDQICERVSNSTRNLETLIGPFDSNQWI